MDEPGVGVGKLPANPNGMNPGVMWRVIRLLCVVVDRLGDGAGRSVDDETGTTHRVNDDAIGLDAFLIVAMRPRSSYEKRATTAPEPSVCGDHLTGRVVEVATDQGAVDLASHPPAVGVDQ